MKLRGNVKQAAKDLGLKVLSVSKGTARDGGEPLILTDDGVFTPTAILEEAAFVTRRKPETR